MSRLKASEQTICVLKTAALYSSILGLGMVMAIFGPTLIDLQHKTGSKPETMSILIGIRSVGSVVGTIGSGFIFDRVNRQVAMALSVLVMGIGTLATPWWSSIGPVFAITVISGIAVGALIAAGNVWILDLWGSASKPFLQALHFFFGLGSFIIPLIAVKFLAPFDDNKPSNVTEVYPEGFYIDTPFTIVGVFAIMCAIAIFVNCFLFPKDASRVETLVNESPTETAVKSNSFKYGLVFLVLFLLSIDCGVETVFGIQLVTYVVHSQHFGLTTDEAKSTGSYLTSLFYGSFVLTRGLTVLVAMKISPRIILLCNLLILTASSSLLVFIGDQKIVYLWIGTALTGIGMANIMPATLNWFESHALISNKIASIFNFAAAAGATILPITCGHFIEETPIVFFYMTMGSALFLIVLYISTNVFINRYGVSETRAGDIDLIDPVSPHEK